MADKYDRYSRDELIKLLRERDRKPRFGLVWERDEIDHDKSENDDFVAMDLDSALSCGEAPWSNYVIEGDNFDALRYLRMTHAGRVKCILIDPPYNTGNKDFIYNDHFVDKDDVYKHSKWLEFLYRRLILARELLAEDGVLLVCINDENRSRLELLLETAMPGMRVGSMVWRTKDAGNDAGKNLSQVHEHILAYANPGFSFQGKPLDTSKYSKYDGGRAYCLDPITKAHDYTVRPNTYYPIQDPDTGYWYPCDPNAVWRYATEERLKPGQKLRGETIESLIRLGLIYFPPCKPTEVMQWDTKDELLEAIRAGKGPVLPKKKTPLLKEDLPDLDFWVGKPIAPGRPSKKSFLDKKTNLIAPVSSWIAGVNEEVDEEMLDELETLRSPRGGEGTDALTAILGSKAFSHPKPPTLMRNLLRQATRHDSLVVDFFAGSGTTAQAVLELNAEDNGTRRFIMVSSTEATKDDPEKNVCRDVCAPRIKAVAEGYGGKEGTGGDFAYLRTRRIPSGRVFHAIQHGQVWLALQMIHVVTVTPFDKNAPIQRAGNILYLPKISEASVKAVTELAQTAALTIYSWQPGVLRQRIDNGNASFEKIPEFLVKRFGGAK